jgi:hypothetical protein
MENNENKNKIFFNKKILGFLPMKILIGASAGILAGFVYYRLVGCSTGSCPITSNPWITMSFFGIFGVIMSSGK